jgi:hypothetical protein
LSDARNVLGLAHAAADHPNAPHKPRTLPETKLCLMEFSL